MTYWSYMLECFKDGESRCNYTGQTGNLRQPAGQPRQALLAENVAISREEERGAAQRPAAVSVPLVTSLVETRALPEVLPPIGPKDDPATSTMLQKFERGGLKR